MAVEGKPQTAAAAKTGAAPSAGGAAGGAPAWVAPVYLAGLALLYLGERVIVTEDKLRMAVSVLGVALLLVATVVRFLPNFRGTGERASIAYVTHASPGAGQPALLAHDACGGS